MNEPHMDEQDEEISQFKMPMEDDPIEDQIIQKEINELKLEKISHRVTLISILIPVLIVVVLVFTYLDIKRRVTQTEDTGAIEFKKLSSDLESRFGSLSVKQARIEDTTARLTEQTNQILASIQVRLEKLDDRIKKTSNDAVGQKEFESTRSDLATQLNKAIEATNEAGEQMASISQALKKQIDGVSQLISDAQLQISELETQVTELKETKIDKATMDLAIRLEALKIENGLKMQLKDILTIVKGLENKVLEMAPKKKSGKNTSSPIVAPPAPIDTTVPKATGSSASEGIEEQTIRQ